MVETCGTETSSLVALRQLYSMQSAPSCFVQVVYYQAAGLKAMVVERKRVAIAAAVCQVCAGQHVSEWHVCSSVGAPL